MKNEVVYIQVMCPLKVGVGFEHTFMYRQPRKGEWFLMLVEGKWHRIQASADMPIGAIILKRSKTCLRTVR